MNSRFGGKDQDMLCALGGVVLNESPSDDRFEVVSDFYSVDRDLLGEEHA